MNILISNQYRQYLIRYDYNVVKEIVGEYDVKDIISTLSKLNYNKIIIDLTAIKDYKDLKSIREMAINILPSNLIILLSNEPITTSQYYISNLINMGIYNFTLRPNEIINLIQKPRNYEQAKQINIKNYNW